MIELANKLLEWNKKYLTYDSLLSVDEIATIFAVKFDVFANGRSYLNVDHETYFDFLQGFRVSIKDINYIVHDNIIDGRSIVLPMTAQLNRIDGKINIFEAMLWLKYDENNKIVLWHEVYTQRDL